jgi:hypothetical protein
LEKRRLEENEIMIKKERRDELGPVFVAIYHDGDEWRLITRELSLLSHAKKMEKTYTKDFATRIVKVVK